ncbi:cupin domain-containing protein [Tritonibacter mobilis]|uniref:cupin domain-containing protein n=1 Tax=Tritonibacter mobilis TaxID=379347 RepID=UPI001C08E692|nr:cupin domain-containing protein [Tritonibacter mobilis]MBU3034096.1 cupin domain-containing protein [Tritonibacter mobilis]WHQ84172.1 cupin domain-containing protein [Tritonibacter mobilis]
MSTLNDRIVRYGELRPCKTAFIDAHTPGSNQKENFTIIGGGVSESPDQHVHIRDTPGFNIGAAGQPPNCRNSLHSHTTAEVFFVLKGRWRFFWGRNGDAGEFIAEEGDIFNIPTGIFRGFENVGTDYGMIMAILGGDDAGGGVTWAPQVIEEARAHGLVLGNNGVLYDTKQGQELPHNVQPMPTLTEEQMKDFPETPVEAVVPRYVARYWDLMALSGRQPAKVIGNDALLKDKPGFEVDFLSRNSLDDSTITPDKHVVLMPMRGHWALRMGDFDTVLNPGDTCLLKPGESYSLAPSMTGEASLYRVTETDDPAGATWSSAA